MTEHTSPLCLVSRWKLKSGLDASLLATLEQLAGQVEAAEPNTLMYRVHLPAMFPLDHQGEPADPPPIALDAQKEVVFVEVYKDAAAFAAHTQGQVFKTFLASTADYFLPDPQRPGWPITDTVFMSPVSGFVRDSLI